MWHELATLTPVRCHQLDRPRQQLDWLSESCNVQVKTNKPCNNSVKPEFGRNHHVEETPGGLCLWNLNLLNKLTISTDEQNRFFQNGKEKQLFGLFHINNAHMNTKFGYKQEVISWAYFKNDFPWFVAHGQLFQVIARAGRETNICSDTRCCQPVKRKSWPLPPGAVRTRNQHFYSLSCLVRVTP